MTYDPDKHDGLVIAPETDGFNHETPLRAFTDWQDCGLYAVGRGFRPAVQHLASYLDAIESKEGWRLVQLLVGDDGRPSAGLFRRRATLIHESKPLDPDAVKAWLRTRPIEELYGMAEAMGIDRATILRDSYRANYTRPARMWKGEIEGHLAFSTRPLGESFEPFEPVVDPLNPPMPADDPINPRHYGGTHCAEIGERLTANCYQVLKYNWRLGEKDDPVQELGKAIWYAERELQLGLPRSRGSGPLPGMRQGFVLERTEEAPWRREIALLLWELCYGAGTEAMWRCVLEELIECLKAKKQEMTPRGRGMEP